MKGKKGMISGKDKINLGRQAGRKLNKKDTFIHYFFVMAEMKR